MILSKKIITLASTGLVLVATNAMAAGTGNPYAVKIGGTVKLDQHIFFNDKEVMYDGNKVGAAYNGAMLRDCTLKLNGGLGHEKLTYEISLVFNAKNNSVSVDDAALQYAIGGYFPNLNVSAGKINPAFSLESTSSSRWVPFLEKSLVNNTLSPVSGLGVQLGSYNKNYTLSFTLLQPQSAQADHNDMIQLAGRGTVALVHADDKLIQVGASASFKNVDRLALRFTTDPEARAKNMINFLETNAYAKNQSSFAIEALGLYGPLSAQAEFQTTKLSSAKNNIDSIVTHKRVSFNGYHAQVAYVLTGESRARSIATGTLGQIIPKNSFGAFEVALRYSHLSLNDKTFFGGQGNNIGTSISWFANKNVKLMLEYVNSRQTRIFNTERKVQNLDSIGARLQFIF